MKNERIVPQASPGRRQEATKQEAGRVRNFRKTGLSSSLFGGSVMSADLSVVFTGIRFENPFLLASAPPTESESNILRAFEAGWGGVVTKTIGLHPVVNVYGAKAKFMRTAPDDARVSMKKREGAALHSSWNWELISDKTLDWWLPRLRS